ncbi:MAG: MBL fold metallo-hydrolase [Acidisphaera sp.]|nr:MBL fold metallo-hydrolase [Acidisphaera sp.]
MAAEEYALDIVVQGYPGKAVCHGGLGWSTIALLRGRGRIALIDVGSFGQRDLLIRRLAERGLRPDAVTDVILTHSHWDHSINWVLFPRAAISIGAQELDWAVGQRWGETPVPELYVRELLELPRTRRVAAGSAVLPGLTAHDAPGHTPGHLIFVLAGGERDVIFTGDAAKNRAELLSRSADMTYDPAVSRASIDRIWALWRQRHGTVLVPGHDVPMVLENDEPKYIGVREAAISAWFGDDLDTTTLFELRVAGE